MRYLCAGTCRSSARLERHPIDVKRKRLSFVVLSLVLLGVGLWGLWCELGHVAGFFN